MVYINADSTTDIEILARYIILSRNMDSKVANLLLQKCFKRYQKNCEKSLKKSRIIIF